MSQSGQMHIDPFSVCAVPIEICCDGDVLGQATGFFLERAGRLFLVSNWHVFSGRDPEDGQPKDRAGYRVPNGLKVSYYPVNNPGFGIQMPFKLISEDGFPEWIQHSKYGQKIDVAAMDTGIPMSSQNRPFTINQPPQVYDMSIPMGSDIFVLGFPLGIMKTRLFPVWKRASVATEIQIDVNDLPCFIIDTATREGMSGSPVIARSFGVYTSVNGAMVRSPTSSQFLGIYSGRYIGRIDDAHLGIVWRAAAIEQIIDHPAPEILRRARPAAPRSNSFGKTWSAVQQG